MMKSYIYLGFILLCIATSQQDLNKSSADTKKYPSSLSDPSEYKCKKEYRVPVPNCKLEYLETFQGKSGKDSKWIYSSQSEYSKQSWIQGYGFVEPTLDCDRALIAEHPATKYGIATLFEKPIDVQEKDLIVQYEVRYQKGLECGGAYIKLLRDGSLAAAQDLTSKTPYTLMFGPDFCGTTNRIHVIIPHYNPVVNEWTEHNLFGGPQMVHDNATHLYTLIIRKDDSIEILVDQINKFTGNLNTDFNPPFSSPKTIADPNDVKPDDWVEQERIIDPNDVKPDDWDETQPQYIIDETAVKPADWLDDEPLRIPDPTSLPPDDWDEEAYGEYEPPLIENPRCLEVSGCGKWEKPTILNPAYKGRYQYKTIPNPAYKGPWVPHFITNPAYYIENKPHNLPSIGGIAIEIWTVNEGLAFDNILITHDEKCAEAFADATFRVKRQIEVEKNPVLKKRAIVPIAERQNDDNIEEEIEKAIVEKWVKKRHARMNLGQFINDMIDETMNWEFDEDRCDKVEKGVYITIISVIVLSVIVYYKNRDFIQKAKLL